MNSNIIELLDLISKVILLPVAGMLWNIQGRLSKIEGALFSRLTSK